MTESSENIPGKINSTERKIRWLASYPKSGNTWVRMFLNAYATYSPINLNTSYQFVTTDIRPEIFQMMCPRPITELTFDEQLMYHTGSLLNLLKMAPTKDVFVKTHNAKVVVGHTTLIPPSISGESIYIVRDPRDVVVSAANHFKITIDEAISKLCDPKRTGLSAFNLHHVFVDWRTHVSSWAIENKTIGVTVFRYEDLLTIPNKAFKAILEIFDFDFDQKRFNFAMEQADFKHLKNLEATKGFHESPEGVQFFKKGVAGTWKKVLTDNQKEIIEDYNKTVMEKYGYL